MNAVFERQGLKLNAVYGDGAGETVIFQHGLCGSAAQTHEAFPKDPRYRLATLECRGHGTSEAGDLKHFSIATFADDVASFVQKPSIIGGISMGAAISLRLAVHKPELVKALIIARPAWFVDANPENGKPNVDVGELLRRLAPAEALHAFMASPIARKLADEAPDNLASLKSFFTREPIAITSALLRAIASDGPGVTTNDLAQIQVPTLIIATEQDYIHPMAHAEALHGAIPHSKLVRITPKGVDKSRYVSEFHATLLNFFETVNAKSH
jgi:pimeloyl-ACP methyl ester carboxylesterase